MAGNFNFSPNLLNYTSFVYQVCCALYPHVFPAIHGFLTPDTKRITDAAIGITNEGKGQFIFFAELHMLLNRVFGNAKNARVHFLEARHAIAKGTSLECTAGRIVFWIKIQNNV